MRRDAILAGTTAFAAALAVLFWSQLRESNKLAAKLRQQVEALTAIGNGNPAPPVATGDAPAPATSSVATVVGSPADDIPTALTPEAKCDATLARTRQSAADEMETWARELRLNPEDTRRITEVRQAQVVARSSCAPHAASNVDQEQLRVQFREALGPARLADFIELNASRSARFSTARLEQQFKEQDMPLSDEQVRRLSAIYLEEMRRFNEEDIHRAYPEESRAGLVYQEANLELARQRWERLQAAGQSLLGPEQRQLLRSIANTELAAMRDSVKLVREMVEKGMTTRPPPLPSLVTVVPMRR